MLMYRATSSLKDSMKREAYCASWIIGGIISYSCYLALNYVRV
jgi:hypothetical protein